jgi:hypothetical protein
MRKLILLVCLLSCSVVIWSQKQIQLKESFVDSASYVYFIQGKHDALVFLTEKALSLGVDSYYLRVRMGVSYFTKNEFYHAVIHLRKALAFYPSDMYTKEFLFYAYVYMENFEEAKLIIAKMPTTFQTAFQKLIKRQNSFVVESGYQTTSYANKQDTAVFLAKDVSDTSLHGNAIYAESDRMKSLQYVQVGMGYPISKRIKGYSGISYVRNNREAHIYTRDKLVKDTSHIYALTQYQVYSGLTITLPKQVNLLVGGQYMYYTQNKLYANYNTITKYKYHDSTTARNNFVSNFSLTKSFQKLIPMLSVGVNSIDGVTIMQYSSQVTYLPFGNFNTSITGGFSLSKDNYASRKVFFGKLAGKITGNWWYDAYFYAGNLKNLTEGNGYVVYNISDKITMKSGLNATYYFNPKMSLGFRYDLLKRESTYERYYSTFNATKVKAYSDKYINNSFILSLLWKF